jgi:hypothetical protein
LTVVTERARSSKLLSQSLALDYALPETIEEISHNSCHPKVIVTTRDERPWRPGDRRAVSDSPQLSVFMNSVHSQIGAARLAD